MRATKFFAPKAFLISSAWVFVAAGFVSAADGIGGSSEPLLVPCASCHMDAKIKADSIPEIKGEERGKLVAVLNSFRTQSRRDTMMHRLLKAYSEEEVKIIATALSKMKP